MDKDVIDTSNSLCQRGLAQLSAEVERVRARLVWLSAKAANLRMLEMTRALLPEELAEVWRMQAESEQLRQELQALREQFDALRVGV